MTIKGYRITTAILALLCVALLVLFLDLKWRTNRMRMDVRYSREVAWGIRTDRDLALKQGVPECIGFLEKHQLACDSPEIFMSDYVEGERKRFIRDIIDRLRSLTGKDLGNDPEGWIEAHETNYFGVK